MRLLFPIPSISMSSSLCSYGSKLQLRSQLRVRKTISKNCFYTDSIASIQHWEANTIEVYSKIGLMRLMNSSLVMYWSRNFFDHRFRNPRRLFALLTMCDKTFWTRSLKYAVIQFRKYRRELIKSGFRISRLWLTLSDSNQQYINSKSIFTDFSNHHLLMFKFLQFIFHYCLAK